PEQINARSPNSSQAAASISISSAGEFTGMLPKLKQIGAGPAAIQAATSSSASVERSSVRAPTNGRLSDRAAHSAARPGKQTFSYAWISNVPRSVMRRGDDEVAFGSPRADRWASSAFLFIRQMNQSLAAMAERASRRGTI